MELALARRKNEVDSLNEALEGAALENQGLRKALAVRDQLTKALEKHNKCLLDELTASKAEVDMFTYIFAHWHVL